MVLQGQPVDPSLEEELKEFDKPPWKQGGRKFDSEEAYEKWYVDLVEDLLSESKTAWRDWKEQLMEVDKRIEKSGVVSRQKSSVSDTAFVPQALEEAVAMMCETQPRPKTANRSPDTAELSGQVNGALDQEFDANEFEQTVMPKTVYNSFKFFIGVQKVTWDRDEPGQFGNKGRTVIRNIDPRYINIDPYAKGFRRSQMRYLIVEEPMDCSEARRRWPDKEIIPEGGSVSHNRTNKKFEDALAIDSPDGDYTVGVRHRVVVKECWLNSDEMKEVPCIDEKTKEYMRDENGKIMKKWVKAYPFGRLLIVANGKLLVDQANPFWHGEFPYAFFPGRVAGKLLSYGAAVPLLRLADKMNQMHKDMMGNLRVNMNAPWVIDRHAFDSPKKFNMLTKDPGLILPVATGARVERLPAGDLPQSVFGFLDVLQKTFDSTIGVSGINRGELEKGAQLSSDAVNQLQASSTARIRLASRRIENGLAFVGYLMQWNIRQFYDSDAQVSVTIPGSEDKQLVGWQVAEQEKGQYTLEMQVGSSLPGSKEAGAALMLRLWDKGLLPREWALRLIELPGAEKIIADIQKREKEYIDMAKQQEGGDPLKEIFQHRYGSEQGGRRDSAASL